MGRQDPWIMLAFKHSRPTTGWVQRFMQRHPRLADRAPSKLQIASAEVSCKDIEDWFTATEHDLAAIPGGLAALWDPARVFNADETSFALDASTGRVVKVIAERGAKHIYKKMQGSKMQISIISCSSPSGNFMPPMIIYPG